MVVRTGRRRNNQQPHRKCWRNSGRGSRWWWRRGRWWWWRSSHDESRTNASITNVISEWMQMFQRSSMIKANGWALDKTCWSQSIEFVRWSLNASKISKNAEKATSASFPIPPLDRLRDWKLERHGKALTRAIKPLFPTLFAPISDRSREARYEIAVCANTVKPS